MPTADGKACTWYYGRNIARKKVDLACTHNPHLDEHPTAGAFYCSQTLLGNEPIDMKRFDAVCVLIPHIF